jgi:hypothetical protein
VIPASALASIPAGLRDPLLDEYRQIVQNYVEHRWGPSELGGGKFCEIVYSILVGHASGSYPAAPAKPNDFPSACRALESNASEPRSFRILIPRMLPALYEVRNNRGVGHAGGDVDPNHMDATVVLSMCNWIMAELVRLLHATTTSEAQSVVDSLAERRIPLVWQSGDLKRVVDPSVSSEPKALLAVLKNPAYHFKRIGLEADPLSQWLYSALAEAGLPVIGHMNQIDARMAFESIFSSFNPR